MNVVYEKNKGYIPTLDGWRAIAIIAVIFHHDSIHQWGFFNTRWLYEFGDVGVDVFFAISGFLICSRLLMEERINGKINLSRFYIRRFLRIVPPAFLYIVLVSLLAKMCQFSLTKQEFFASLFLYRNYPTLFGAHHWQFGWYTEHFWSLSIEEQFYLLFPAILIMTVKRYRIPVLVVIAVLVEVHRALALRSHSWSALQFHADVRIDALLIPALLAVLISFPEMKAAVSRALRFWPVLLLITLCVIPLSRGSAWDILLTMVLMTCLVVGSALNPDNFFGRLLEWKALKFIGRISYSLYLWQQLFFTGHFVPSYVSLGIFQAWPVRLLATAGCALISFYLVERPAIRLGRRFAI